MTKILSLVDKLIGKKTARIKEAVDLTADFLVGIYDKYGLSVTLTVLVEMITRLISHWSPEKQHQLFNALLRALTINMNSAGGVGGKKIDKITYQVKD